MTYGEKLNTKRANSSPNFAGEKIQTTQNIPNMNMRNGILGLLFMAIVPLSAQTSERGLKECIRMGIERNLGLKNARISIESGRTTVTQARANLLPQVKWNNLQVLESFRTAELGKFDYLCDQYEKIGL